MLNFFKKEPKNNVAVKKSLLEEYFDLKKQLKATEKALQTELTEKKIDVYKRKINLHRSIINFTEFGEITYRLQAKELISENESSIGILKSKIQLNRIKKNLEQIEAQRLNTQINLLKSGIFNKEKSPLEMETDPEILIIQNKIHRKEKEVLHYENKMQLLQFEIERKQQTIEDIVRISNAPQPVFLEKTVELERELQNLKEYGEKIGVRGSQLIYQAPETQQTYKFINMNTAEEGQMFQCLQHYFKEKNVILDYLTIADISEEIEEQQDEEPRQLTADQRITQRIYQMAIEEDVIFIIDLDNWVTAHLIDDPILNSNFIFIVRQGNQNILGQALGNLWLGLCENVDKKEVQTELAEDCLYFHLPNYQEQDRSTVIVLSKEESSNG